MPWPLVGFQPTRSVLFMILSFHETWYVCVCSQWHSSWDTRAHGHAQGTENSLSDFLSLFSFVLFLIFNFLYFTFVILMLLYFCVFSSFIISLVCFMLFFIASKIFVHFEVVRKRIIIGLFLFFQHAYLNEFFFVFLSRFVRLCLNIRHVKECFYIRHLLLQDNYNHILEEEHLTEISSPFYKQCFHPFVHSNCVSYDT